MGLKEFQMWQLRKMYAEANWVNDYVTAINIAEEMVARKPHKDKYKVALAKMLITNKNYKKAYLFLQTQFNSDPFGNGEIAFYLAELEKQNKNYHEAKEILMYLRPKTRRIEMGPITRERIDKSIAGCDLALSYKDTLVYTRIEHLGSGINSSQIEFGPKLISDDEMIFGSLFNIDDLSENLSNFYKSKRGFKYATQKDSSWMLKDYLPEPYFNYIGFDTGEGAFSLDGLRFYFTKCTRNINNRYICHLYMTVYENGNWSTPIELNSSINKRGFSSSQPTVGTCYDPTLEVIYFVSDKKGGAGGKDIWFSVYDKKTKKHSIAYNAGVYINTSGDEITPFYDLESHALFFSSNGLPSIGGFDIFYSRGEFVNWQDAINIGYPINSSYDDLDYFRNESGKKGFFTSNRLGVNLSVNQQALNDIFSFKETKVARVFVSGRIKTKDILTGEGFGDMLDNQNYNSVLSNQIISISQLSDTSASLLIKETYTNEDGEFGVWLDRGHEYRADIKDTLVVSGGFRFTTDQSNDQDFISLDLKPVLTIPNKPIEIQDIHYEFDRTELTMGTKQSLDSTLLIFVEKYPDLVIRIISHTDNIGSERYNQRLSEKRATNVVKYLVSRGVGPDRLKAEGRGESDPIAPNENTDGSDNPEGREKNRRTEFEIIGVR